MKAQYPNIISNLNFQDLSETQVNQNGKWAPARPISYPSLRRRFHLAWLVFTGKADALVWFGQDDT